ncbi:MAG: response regulator transcription factor [Flavobacteriia bacterium]|nr:response regulator transcription factor [Flavobacteriia bacterium]
MTLNKYDVTTIQDATTAVIIDDEFDARRIINKYLERYFPQIVILGEASSKEEGLQLLRTVKPSIVFLDINLGDGSGFELMDNLKDLESSVIFTTAFDNYAVQAFRYHALDYLLKPIDPDAFEEAVGHALSITSADQSTNIQQWIAHYGNSERKLAVPTSDGLRFIQLDVIIFMEADSSYCTIYLNDGKHVLVSRPLKYFSDKLEGERVFLRPHKSFIINMNYLQEYVKEDGGALKLTNGHSIPISRQKKDEVLKEMNNFFL